jgi:hypothetical protein
MRRRYLRWYVQHHTSVAVAKTDTHRYRRHAFRPRSGRNVECRPRPSSGTAVQKQSNLGYPPSPSASTCPSVSLSHPIPDKDLEERSESREWEDWRETNSDKQENTKRVRVKGALATRKGGSEEEPASAVAPVQEMNFETAAAAVGAQSWPNKVWRRDWFHAALARPTPD